MDETNETGTILQLQVPEDEQEVKSIVEDYIDSSGQIDVQGLKNAGYTDGQVFDLMTEYFKTTAKTLAKMRHNRRLAETYVNFIDAKITYRKEKLDNAEKCLVALKTVKTACEQNEKLYTKLEDTKLNPDDDSTELIDTQPLEEPRPISSNSAPDLCPKKCDPIQSYRKVASKRAQSLEFYRWQRLQTPFPHIDCRKCPRPSYFTKIGKPVPQNRPRQPFNTSSGIADKQASNRRSRQPRKTSVSPVNKPKDADQYTRQSPQTVTANIKGAQSCPLPPIASKDKPTSYRCTPSPYTTEIVSVDESGIQQIFFNRGPLSSETENCDCNSDHVQISPSMENFSESDDSSTIGNECSVNCSTDSADTLVEVVLRAFSGEEIKPWPSHNDYDLLVVETPETPSTVISSQRSGESDTSSAVQSESGSREDGMDGGDSNFQSSSRDAEFRSHQSVESDVSLPVRSESTSREGTMVGSDSECDGRLGFQDFVGSEYDINKVQPPDEINYLTTPSSQAESSLDQMQSEETFKEANATFTVSRETTPEPDVEFQAIGPYKN